MGLDRIVRTSRIGAGVTLAASAVLVALALTGCHRGVITEEPGSYVTTGSVQATLPASSGATGSTAATVSSSPTAMTAAGWPAKASQFAKSAKYTVWYPLGMPSGFKLQTLDIVELDPGSGLVLNMVLMSGDKTVTFTQGSPKERSYQVDSMEKVPWGTATADVVSQDPADPSAPIIIVYNQGGNFAELQGDLTNDQLKAIAASMVAVK